MPVPGSHRDDAAVEVVLVRNLRIVGSLNLRQMPRLVIGKIDRALGGNFGDHAADVVSLEFDEIWRMQIFLSRQAFCGIEVITDAFLLAPSRLDCLVGSEYEAG